MGKIDSFQDLEVWKEGHKLVLMVYRMTKEFPGEEKFGLVTQMRRAAVSIPANIAEGFKRRRVQDKIRFYNTAESSLEELKYYFILSKDLEYISLENSFPGVQKHSFWIPFSFPVSSPLGLSDSSSNDLIAQAETTGRLLNGLITSTERRL